MTGLAIMAIGIAVGFLLVLTSRQRTTLQHHRNLIFHLRESHDELRRYAERPRR